MARYFITSTGTGIGKTFVTCSLLHEARKRGQQAAAIKPIISGFEGVDDSDFGEIADAMGLPRNDESLGRISPWRYRAPLTPSIAAEMEGAPLPFEEMVAWCAAQPNTDLQLIEGVGGIMAPLTPQHTVLDWMKALGVPLVVVAGNYLGSLSHTLSALEVLKMYGLHVKALVISESCDGALSLESHIRELQRFMVPEISVVALPRAASYREAAISPLFDTL